MIRRPTRLMCKHYLAAAQRAVAKAIRENESMSTDPYEKPDCYQIIAPYFTAGIVVHDNEVVQTAPIIYTMLGWPLTRVQTYCYSKGWKVTKVSSPPPDNFIPPAA